MNACLASRPNRRSSATSSSVANRPTALLTPTRSAIRSRVPSPQPMSTRWSPERRFSTASAIRSWMSRVISFLSLPQRQIVRVARVLSRFAAVFHVIVGAGNHQCRIQSEITSSPNLKTCTTFPRRAGTTASVVQAHGPAETECRGERILRFITRDQLRHFLTLISSHGNTVAGIAKRVIHSIDLARMRHERY